MPIQKGIYSIIPVSVHDHSSPAYGGQISWPGISDSIMKAHCRVYRNTTQSIAAATETMIEFNAKSYDFLNYFDIENYRANFNASGKIWVVIKICVSSSANNRQITLSIDNASGLISHGFMPVVGGVGISTIEFSDLVDISDSDYLYITILCSEALTIQAGADRTFAIFSRWSA